MNIKKWEVKELNKKYAQALVKKYEISSLLAMLLDIRGYTSDEEIEGILQDEGSLSDPYLMKDMDIAVERISTAVDNFERIAVYGDYDADGVTATAILFSYLETIGADVMYYIPKRDGEGYGMNIPAVEKLAEMGVKLIVTVDNGIASVEEVKRANELHMDVVVTDHHRPHEVLPPAYAVVDPHRADCSSPFKELCGAGVVLKLLIAMEKGDADMILAEYADLAAIGTVADVVCVAGENRTIIREGLDLLANSERPGIVALLEKSGCLGQKLTARTLAFTIVPRINATGRMGRSERAVRLLASNYEDEAQELAEEICDENESRKITEANILKEVIKQIEESETLCYDRVLVIDGSGWHHGVVGIAAARIVDRYGKPAVIISREENEARGSGRSVEGFSLFDAITSCKDLLSRFGGHPMAIGLSLNSDNIGEFRRRINKYAENVCPEMPAQKIVLDCKLNPAILSPEIVDSLSVLEPFGQGNPYPIFGLYNMKIENITPLGGGKHLKIGLSREKTRVEAMSFGTRLEEFPYEIGSVVDLAVNLESREYRGNPQLTVQIKGIRYKEIDDDICIKTQHIYEAYKRGEFIDEAAAKYIIPTRDELAAVYRNLTAGENRRFLFSILSSLNKNGITIGKLLVCIEIFTERELAQCRIDGEWLTFTTVKHQGAKINIYDSKVFSDIKALVKV